MCRFEYTEYKPCGCELYVAEDIVSHVVKPWFPTLVIRRTDELGDLDFFHQGRRFVTRRKDRKGQFPSLPCPKRTFTRRNVLDRAENGCPWHDDMVKKWELINRRGDREGERAELHQKARGRKGSVLRTVKEAVMRGGARASDARR